MFIDNQIPPTVFCDGLFISSVIMTNGFITKYIILTAAYKWSQTYVCTVIFHI